MSNVSRKLVAIIPARAGSKRVLNKNVQKLGTTTLLGRTISVALESNLFNDVIVSTNSQLIAKHAIQFGASVPFMRPETLASDYASTDDVITHSIDELKLSNDDIVFILQPTSPFRQSQDLIEVAKLLETEKTSGVVSVCECEHPPLWSNTLPNDLRMENFISPEVGKLRSQDIPTYYRLNGAIFAYRVKYFKQYGRNYTSAVRAYIMPISRSLDIDTEDDLKLARLLNSKPI